MYEDRYVAFIDILGFGSLVEKSAENLDLANSIYQALLSMNPAQLEEDMHAFINKENTPEHMIEEVKAALKVLKDIIKSNDPVTISYFSDSLVLSAAADSPIASQTILELIAKLSIVLWNNYSLLIRGGITFGKLVHIENGPLFGPAMNRAYLLESTMAKTPRVILDNVCIEKYRSVKSFGLFENLLNNDESYSYFSLISSFKFITEFSSLALHDNQELRSLKLSKGQLKSKIDLILESKLSERVKNKYEWLKSEIE